VELQDVFKGTSMQCLNLDNEKKMWKKIEEVVDESIAKYPTTLEEDNAILEKDDQEQTLSYNERNCILYRQGEKIILHFLKTCSQRFVKLLGMSQKDAKKEVNSYKGFEVCHDYFRHTVMNLIHKPEGNLI